MCGDGSSRAGQCWDICRLRYLSLANRTGWLSFYMHVAAEDFQSLFSDGKPIAFMSCGSGRGAWTCPRSDQPPLCFQRMADRVLMQQNQSSVGFYVGKGGLLLPVTPDEANTHLTSSRIRVLPMDQFNHMRHRCFVTENC